MLMEEFNRHNEFKNVWANITKGSEAICIAKLFLIVKRMNFKIFQNYKNRKRLIFIFLSIAMLPGILFLFFQKTPKTDFSSWYASKANKAHGLKKDYIFYDTIILSDTMRINKIMRSMEGPFSIANFTFGKGILNYFSPQLICLTGYQLDVIDANTNKTISDDFMCHNNMNIVDKNTVPWKLETQGSNTRLFTITEGQTQLQLPKGYGIPVLSNQKLEIVSQVLNHNIADTNFLVRQRIKITYIKEIESGLSMKPVYQQSAFVTKFVSGPEGNFGESIKIPSKINSNSKACTTENMLSCGVEKPEPGIFDPFHDQYGREFTGHWKFNPGVEVLVTNVSKMINITRIKKAYYVSVHVHPFCETLSLYDATTKDTLIKAHTKSFRHKIGLENIEQFTFEKGLTFYPSHKYLMVSYYNNPTQDIHTAMATMFLYMDEN
jgi:hypothetical protein